MNDGNFNRLSIATIDGKTVYEKQVETITEHKLMLVNIQQVSILLM